VIVSQLIVDTNNDRGLRSKGESRDKSVHDTCQIHYILRHAYRDGKHVLN